MSARDITRLPQWAQKTIHQLEADLAQANLALQEGPGNSNVFRQRGLRREDQPIGRNLPIRFTFGDRVGFNAITVRHEPGRAAGLDIIGDDRLVIVPLASNHIGIRFTER